MLNRFSLVAGLISLGLAHTAAAQNIQQLWQQNCASCHGENAGGGSAPTMLDDDWATDGSDPQLYDAVWNGLEDRGMPAYKGGLSEPQVWGLIVYLHELRFQASQGDIPVADKDGTYDSQHHRYQVETVVENVDGLSRPWAIDFLPTGEMIVTERSGKLYLFDQDGQAQLIHDTPEVWAKSQGGLLDVAVHPASDQDQPWIYLTYSVSANDDPSKGSTALARGKIDLDNLRWTDQQVLFRPEEDDMYSAGVHFGSRIVFDGDGHVFFVVGERGQQQPSQGLESATGKIHRVNEDGSIPDDNPFVDSNAPTTWTLGHRNPQGLSMHPETGKLYTVEHGPRGGDELNLLEKGKNYGWPVVSYTMNYNMTPFGDSAPFHEPRGFTEPVHYWIPAIAVCGSSFYTGDQFANWKNDLFVAALAKTSIHRVRLGDDGRSITEDEILLQGMGRVRDVVTGPDGNLYAALEQPGRIVKISPAE